MKNNSSTTHRRLNKNPRSGAIKVPTRKKLSKNTNVECEPDEILDTPNAPEEITDTYSETQPDDLSSDNQRINDDLEIQRVDKVRKSKIIIRKSAAKKAHNDNQKILNKFKNKAKHYSKKLLIRQVVFGLGVSVILGSTGYLSVNIMQTNEQALQVSAKTSELIVRDSSIANQPVFDQSTNSGPLPFNALANYQVAPDQPRAIYINKINVSARVIPMGVNDDNSLQSPINSYDAGWYNSSSKPGQDGAMLFDGHGSESGSYYGLFGYISTLNVNDKITVERGDGAVFNYIVVNKEITPLAEVDMSKMLVPYGGVSQGINLISCTGEWTSDHTTLDHRVMVYAVLQN